MKTQNTTMTKLSPEDSEKLERLCNIVREWENTPICLSKRKEAFLLFLALYKPSPDRCNICIKIKKCDQKDFYYSVVVQFWRYCTKLKTLRSTKEKSTDETYEDKFSKNEPGLNILKFWWNLAGRTTFREYPPLGIKGAPPDLADCDMDHDIRSSEREDCKHAQDEELAKTEMRQLVIDYTAKLPEPFKTIFLGRHLDGMTWQELATKYGSLLIQHSRITKPTAESLEDWYEYQKTKPSHKQGIQKLKKALGRR